MRRSLYTEMMNVRRGGAWQLQVAILCLGIAVAARVPARGEPASPDQARAWKALSHEFDEQVTSPAQDSEFVLSHGDNVEASGFVQHLKLPHYVTFESELQLIRALREERGA